LPLFCPLADPGLSFGGIADGANIEAPQALSDGIWGGGVSHQWRRGVGRRLCPLPRKCLYFCLGMVHCVRACVHMITQFKTPVLIRLKPAKSSDIVTKPCKVVTRLCFSGIGLFVCKQD